MVVHRDLSKASEDYLEAIYELAGEGNNPVRSVDIATKLGVSRPSVNNALAVLKKKGLVQQEPYGSILLTEEGSRYGRETLSKHTMLYHFLHDVLGVEEETAEEEACEIEHAISDDTKQRWERNLHDQLKDKN